MDTNIIRDEGSPHEDSRLVSYSSLREDPDVDFDITIKERLLDEEEVWKVNA